MNPQSPDQPGNTPQDTPKAPFAEQPIPQKSSTPAAAAPKPTGGEGAARVREAAPAQPRKTNAELDAEMADEMAQFDALLDQHLPGETKQAPRGEIIEVPVVAIEGDRVLVDVGGKAEGTIRLDEFPKIGDEPQVKVGDIIRVMKTGGDHGDMRLSFRDARAREAEDVIRKAQEQQKPIVGIVSSIVKGGLMVDVGLMAFMPASQVDLFKIPDLNTLVGKTIEAYVIEFDPRRKRAVLSRRQLLFERREGERREAMAHLKEGAVVTGTVKTTLDFGVFVELGSVDGFIPREEVSYDRGTHPKDILKVGEKIEAVILKIDEQSGKITLSRKKLTPDPWDGIEFRFPINSRVTGYIIAVQAYGAFVHLQEGVTGMIHASDLSWNTGQKNPKDLVKVGDQVEALVLDVNADQRRLSLGLKQLEANPWAEAESRYSKGNRFKGTITSLTQYGAFVKLDDYVEGMIHVSDMAWDKHVNHPKEVLEVGQEVEVVVLKTDIENKRISLGMKQLQLSPFDQYLKDHKVGAIVDAKVIRFAPFGAFVELAPGVEGLIHISQIDTKRVDLPEKALQLNEMIKVKISKVEAKKQKIGVSRRDAIIDTERAEVKAYMKKDSDFPTGMTFGEALSQAKDRK
ncbi:MAG: S1 RNA-binding domain-containing protein [Candidatus Sumerlaeia bacterium]|nr:S1 RNA-binding domain-containing protein [Candidatus Sumerlaeia bacterium]